MLMVIGTWNHVPNEFQNDSNGVPKGSKTCKSPYQGPWNRVPKEFQKGSITWKSPYQGPWNRVPNQFQTGSKTWKSPYQGPWNRVPNHFQNDSKTCKSPYQGPWNRTPSHFQNMQIPIPGPSELLCMCVYVVHRQPDFLRLVLTLGLARNFMFPDGLYTLYFFLERAPAKPTGLYTLYFSFERAPAKPTAVNIKFLRSVAEGLVLLDCL